ncbi:MAG TPA: NADH-quinone oxidoreductase subunit C [Propionibacteriaceae bacterium]|nr:NADH-quinone oxidoreductase subunit C [Propionibacteriaceae bacterium]
MTTVLTASRDDLADVVGRLLAEGRRLVLVAAHEEPKGFRVVYVLLGHDRTEVVVTMPRDDAWLPSLAATSYPAGRFEREIRDLYGIRLIDHPLPHRLVRHAHWPTGYYPMLSGAGPMPPTTGDASYPFLEVEGDGVYEIPVGPIHAGLIEPGHFRFSVVGETILRMKARLWFLHRGVEKHAEGRTLHEVLALTERISGDTAVGHSLAYAMAVEDALGVTVSDEARLVRAQLLECERVYNHVADIGAIVNDVGFSIVAVHTARLRETLLRHHEQVTGHRLLRGAVTVGGATLLRPVDTEVVGRVAAEAAELAHLAMAHSVVADRLHRTAVLSAEKVRHMDVLGYVARASGSRADTRVDHPFVELGPAFRVVSHPDGDVWARFLVRVGELAVSAAVIEDLSRRLAGHRGDVVTVATGAGAGFAVVEAWRGRLCHRVELAGGVLTRLKVVDPSWFTWPALPQALSDTIVPDFPLANKSFNMSYAGNDL